MLPTRDEVLAAVTVILVTVSLTIAIIDISSRPLFLELTKFTVGIYIGLSVPRTR
ncbi:MAG: hypothetical protein V7K67_04150 [Nostoc sp.]|uniref:hypothetical protein n=1 Tax=Nostoc sp. TaxID=1180 RepID=UPI002FFB7915